MAVVVYQEPVEYLSGKLAKSHEIIFCYRSQSGRCYTTIRGERKTAPSKTELAHRKRFGATRKAALVRAANLETVDADRKAWRAEHRQRGTNYSFPGWLFKEEWNKSKN
jgi:hypothetical protein